MIYLQALTRAELKNLILPLSELRLGKKRAASPEKQAAYRAKQIFQWFYQRNVSDYDQMSDLSKDLRAWLKENVTVFPLRVAHESQAEDGTFKVLWSLEDHKTIESVVIPARSKSSGDPNDPEDDEEDAPDDFDEEGPPYSVLPKSRFAGVASNNDLRSNAWTRLTICISSQVGCAMACKFCLTGVQGLDRHLKVEEIVSQVHELRKRAPLTNIVFMGMGEPLHNLDAVSKACEILLDECGMNFSKRKVTVSTSGLVPAIEELGRRVNVSLAISLNASYDEQRSQIMPVNKKWNIAALMEACRKYPLGTHRRITFEYVLLKDFNDSLEDAARVIQITKQVPCKINLIPFNEHPGADFKRPSDVTVRAFQKYLLDRGVTATVRISRGRDILAACGQLRSLFGTARGSDKHRDFSQTIPMGA